MEIVGALVRDTRDNSNRVGIVLYQEDEWLQVEFGIYRVWIQEVFVEFVEEEV